MNTPHKHAAVIKAWADGAQIERRKLDSRSALCRDWSLAKYPSFSGDWEYRVKPEPHKWQTVIDAYEAGKEVQYRVDPKFPWSDWKKGSGRRLFQEDWDISTGEYRIKPELVVRWLRVNEHGSLLQGVRCFQSNVKLTFEDDQLIKAEVLPGV